MSKNNCRYGNKKCVLYDGKRITYTNKNDLIEKFVKMGMRRTQARKWAGQAIKNQTKRVVIDADGNFEVFDMRDQFKGMLRTNFNIKAVRNATVIQGGILKNNEFVNEIKGKDKLKYTVLIILYVNWPSPNPVGEAEITVNGVISKTLLRGYVAGGDILRRKVKMIFDVPKDRIAQKVTEHVNMLKNTNYFRGGTILAHRYNILTSFTNKLVKRSQYFLGENEYTLEQWTNIEYLGKWQKGGDSCAVKFISNHFPDLYWDIKKLETREGISLEVFENFCTKNGIMFVFFDVNGVEIVTNSNDKIFGKVSPYHYNQVVKAIIYENHIYPFSGGELKRVAKNPRQIELITDAEEKFYRLWKSGILPSNVKIGVIKNPKTKKDEARVTEFVFEKIKYFENKEYDRCVEILKKFNITENIPHTVSIIQIPQIIMSAERITQAMLSFFPDKDNYKSNALMYQKSGEIDMNRLVGEDKNKAYGWALANLPYLISHDWRKHRVSNIEEYFDPVYITDHYLYLIRAKYFTTMLPKSGLYPGYYLKKCADNGIEFDFIEEFETVQCHNYYRDIILNLYKYLTNDEFKKVMVILIGKMERNIQTSVKFKFESIQAPRKPKINLVEDQDDEKYEFDDNGKRIFHHPDPQSFHYRVLLIF